MIHNTADFISIFQSGFSVVTFKEQSFVSTARHEFDLVAEVENQKDVILLNRDYCFKLYLTLIKLDKISQNLFIRHHLYQVSDKLDWLKDLSGFIKLFESHSYSNLGKTLPDSLKYIPQILDQLFEEIMQGVAFSNNTQSLKVNLTVNELGYFLRKICDYGLIETSNKKAMFNTLSQFIETKGSDGTVSEKKLSNSFYDEHDLKTIDKVQTIFAQCMQLCIKDK